MSERITRALIGAAALALAAGCGTSGHLAGSPNAGAGRHPSLPTSVTSSVPVTVGSGQLQAGLAAVQADLQDAGSAADQANADVDAATSAQAQNDNP